MNRSEIGKFTPPWAIERSKAIKLATLVFDEMNSALPFAESFGDFDFRVKSIWRGRFKTDLRDLRVRIDRDQPLVDSAGDFVVFLNNLHIPEFYPTLDTEIKMLRHLEDVRPFDVGEGEIFVDEEGLRIAEAELYRDTLSVVEKSTDINCLILDEPQQFFWIWSLAENNSSFLIVPQVESIANISTQTILSAYGIFLRKRERVLNEAQTYQIALPF